MTLFYGSISYYLYHKLTIFKLLFLFFKISRYLNFYLKDKRKKEMVDEIIGILKKKMINRSLTKKEGELKLVYEVNTYFIE